MTLGYSNPNDAMDDVIDPEEETLKLASGFRHAQDDDTMAANNLIASAHSANCVKQTKYHAIEMRWYRGASPVLTGESGTRESIGQMHNDRLYDPCSSLICSQFEHGVDYVLVGPNVWLLLSHKFGFDVDIKLPLVYVSDSTTGRVHIQLSASASIPLVGRFPYEKFLERPANATQETVVSDDPTAEEEEEENDQMEQDVASHDQVLLLPPPTSQPTRRRFGSGLGNLGNTCFMNSTLQCLAHTEPLTRYFLSGEYRQDLNSGNPLGTGGDLATEFSTLLGEMWTGDKLAVYPRQFKMTLGKHAEQFVGYDQHDSQELATYLLDALHEDCNRVTRKPYFEKPEQGPNETDEEAADKAWNLHLQRDDSHIVDNFMGQVKSRLECPRCDRVSTTFDPFMFLSVPVPGSEERVIKLHYIPLNPRQRPVKMDVKVSKLATMDDFAKAAMELRKKDGFSVPSSIEDTALIDVHNREIWAWHRPTDTVDIIRETDVTFMYELLSSAEVRKHQEGKKPSSTDLNIEYPTNRRRLDVSVMTRLNSSDSWMNELHKYLVTPLTFENAMHATKGRTEARVRFYRRLLNFLELCDAPESPKRTREEMEQETAIHIEDACREHGQFFKGVKTEEDLAILEFIARKLYKEIQDREKSEEDLDIRLEVKFRKATIIFGEPFVLRIPPGTTVYELRHILANRFQRFLVNESPSAGEPTSESTPPCMDPTKLLLTLPLTYERRPVRSTGKTMHYHPKKSLGSIPVATFASQLSETQALDLADPSQSKEQDVVSDVVGEEGKVFLEFTEKTHESFDTREYEAIETMTAHDEQKKEEEVLSVYDCIEKYCQREQLEESEQWYCSKCKDRVCAWKQFEIFRSPRHLIVHLKRFQFSATSHRRQKIGTFIDFPLEGLDLRNHVHHWKDDEKPIYDCYAVSNHFGGLGGGHYTAYAVNEGNIWCNYDDSRITEHVNPKEVVSESAYVLYYRRRDVPVAEDYEIDLTTPDTKIPAVISDSYSRSSLWDTSRVISSDAAMVDDDEMDHVSTSSNAAITRDATYFYSEDDDNDVENQFDNSSPNDPFLEQ